MFGKVSYTSCGVSIRFTGCADGELRLFDGPSQSQGRLEVCLEGTWGSVCNDGWISNLNGLVVCRELGFNATGIIMTLGVDMPT